MSTVEDFEPSSGPMEKVQDFLCRNYMIYQRYVDRTTPHVVHRWISFGVLALLFALRIVTYQGFYVVAYAWAIYLLNIFLLFLSPRFNPEDDPEGLGNSADLSDGLFDGMSPSPAKGMLPLKSDEEFRPFIRRLPEFKFWYNATWSTVVALGCTLFSFFDIPVFWPILLMYFVFLFFLTMRRQVHHMIRYKYIPFDIGKKSYNGISRK